MACARIYGVCPRGLIEAPQSSHRNTVSIVASTGSAPVASLKRGMNPEARERAKGASTGSAPVASLKHDTEPIQS